MNMAISSQHVTGFAVGLGAAAVGFYLYKKNQHQVDDFLRKHGIELPAAGALDVENLTLEQLVAEKERLEDIIAEREYAAEQEPEAAEQGVEKAPAKPKRTRKKAARQTAKKA
jgi:hypothetical protein